MNTLATVVNLTGRAWAVAADGTRRELNIGDRLRGDEMLVTEPGARVDLDFDNNQMLTFLGEQQQNIGEAIEFAQAELPPSAPRPAAEGRQQPQAQPAQADGEPEGHNFVQLVRINEIIEADGITPLTLARLQELLRPLGMSLPERVYDLDEWREHRGGDERYEDAPAARHPGLTVELQGAGPDGIYSEAEIGPDGTVPAEVTLDDKVRVGDRLVIKDGKGNTLLDRPVTQDDLDNGVTVEVPVAPGDRNVTVEATVTTPRGYTGQDRDDKPVDNLPPDEVTILPPQDSEDAESINLDLGSYFEDNVDGKDLTYDVTGLPPGLSFDPDTGIITGTIDRSASQGGPDDDGVYKVTVTITDKVGNQTTIDFDWTVTNPEPEARDDRQTIDEDTVATGNVLTGAGNDPGVDGSDSDPDGDDLTVTSFTIGNDPTVYPADGTPVSVEDADGNVIGEITLNEDGDYTFTPVPDWNGSVPDINYTISDGEGGQDEARLSITVAPVNDPVELENIPDPNDPNDPGYPAVNDPTDPNDPARGNANDHVVFESALPGGSDQSPNQADLKVESSFTINAPDGLHASQGLVLTYTNINGESRTLNLGKEQIEQLGSSNQTVDTQYGKLVLNGHTLNADGTISIGYEYTLERAPGISGEHVDERINIAVRDSDAHHPSDTDSKDLVIRIIDDAPVARNDANGIDEDTAVPVTGNVIANGSTGDVADTLGADGATVTGVTAGDQTAGGHVADGGVAGNIVGDYGTLVLNADGSYSYELDNSNLAVQGLHPDDAPLTDVFTYTITDADGDQSTATLTITVNGSNDGVTVTVPDPNDPADPNYPTINDPTDPNDPARGNVNDHVVFESGLAGGSATNADDTRVVSSFTLSALDGLDDTAAITIEVAGNTLTLNKAEVEDLGNNSQSITTEYGELVLNDYTLNADGSITIGYEYTLTSAPDNSGVHTDERISITVNDRDTDSDSQDLVIRIIDDAPVARDDANEIAEDAVSVGGNVITGGSPDDVADTEGADGAEVTAIVSDNDSTSTATANADGDLVIVGEFGTLTISPDGSYTYALNNDNAEVNALKTGETLVDEFTYTLTDIDGDSDTATLTITINGNTDGAPTIVPEDVNGPDVPTDITTQGHVTVHERGLTGADSSHINDGSVTITAPDGLQSITVGGVPVDLGQLAALDPGDPSTHIEIDTPQGKLTLTGFDVTDSVGGVPTEGELQFTYELEEVQTTPADSADPDVGRNSSETIPLDVTDAGGGTGTGNLVINIIDDVPVAVDDTNVITEDQLLVTGNVIGGPSASAGDEADTEGADGATVTEIGNAVSGNSMTTLPNGDLVIEGQYGTLTIRPDGFYSYELNNEHPEVNALKDGSTPLQDVFTYTLTDGDGDSDTAILTITINGNTDGIPTIVPEDVNGPDVPTDITTQGHVTVHERGLTGSDSSHINDGSVTITAPDGLQSITVGGVPVDLAQLAALDPNDPATHIEIDTPQGKLTLTGFDVTDSVGGVPTEGELRFTYELEEAQTTPADPADPDAGRNSTETIPLDVTDAGGGTGTGNLVINIIDDVPVARDDANEIAEDAVSVGGNVITGGSTDDVADTEGADGAEVTGVIAGAHTSGHVADGGVGVSVTGQYGSLTLNDDGSYSYELDNSNLDVQRLTDGDTLTEVFTYTITDGDGDQSTATLTITVNGTDDGVTVEVPETPTPADPGIVDPNDPTKPGTGVELSDNVVFESGLPGGSNEGQPGAAESTRVESSFTLVALDGLATSGAVELTFTNSNGNPQTQSLSKEQVEQLGSTPVTLVTEYGELVLKGYSQETDPNSPDFGIITIDYEYILLKAPEVSGVDVLDTIGIKVTDRDGDQDDSQDLVIRIIDDAPVARDDTNEVSEDAAAPVVGNVITSSVAGEDDIVGADGATVTGVIAGDQTGNGHVADVGVTDNIVGDYGTLVLNADGSYSYVLDNSNLAVQGLHPDDAPLTDVFTYTITDADGDQSTATLTITVNGSNDGVTVTVPDPNDPADPNYPTINDPTDPNDPARGNVNDHVVFESGLAGGSATNADDTRVVSSFTLSALDGLDNTAAITIEVAGNSLTLSKAEVEDLANSSQSISTEYGELVLNGYTPNADGSITIDYEYSLTSAPDNTGGNGDSTDERISITVNDRDTDSDSQDLVIRIIDDAPVARDDTNQVDEDVLSVDGNVITSSVAGEEDTVGADGATVTGVTTGDQTAGGHVADGNVGTVISGQYGDLTLNADGSYSYQLDNSNLVVQGLTDGDTLTETFTYTITDADGDQSTATLTITVNGTNDGVTVDVPVNDSATTADGNVNDHVVFESGLTNGSAPNADDLRVESSFTLVALDGLATSSAVELTFTNTNGNTQTLSLSKEQVEQLDSDPVTLITQYGELVLNGYDRAADGTITIEYEYTLQRAPEVDAVDVRDAIGIKVTDRDGDQDDSQSISIKIVDDAPQAADDTNTIAEEELSVVGNVRSNDQQGADGAEVTAIVSDNASGNSATTLANGDLVIEGQYGTLTISPDGSYTYELDNSNPDIQGLHPNDTPLEEVFSYTLTDGDNDSDTAQLTISITGSNDGVTVTVPDPTDPADPNYPVVDPADPNDPARGNVNDHVVFESGLSGGSATDAADTRVESSFTLSALDGLDDTAAITIEVAGNTLKLSKSDVEALDSNIPGTHQSIITEYGELVLNDYTLNADGSITIGYEYTLTSAPDNTGGNGDLTDERISITVNDRDTDSDSQDLVIRIIDDAPVARDDANEIAEDDAAVTGNVITGGSTDDVADTEGADGAEVTAIVSDNDSTSTATTNADGDLVIVGEFGTLTIQPNGEYEYVLNNGNAEVNKLKDGETLTEEFTYTLTDGDGDSDTARLTITINGKTDGSPSIVPNDENGGAIDGHITVHESGLRDPADADDSNIASGTIQISAGDGLASITIGGQTFSLADLQVLSASTPSAAIPVEGGTLVLTGFTPGTSVGGVPTSGELQYTYTLTGERTHSAQGNDAVLLDIPLSVTDAGNETANGTLTIQVVDDVPTAVDDTAEVAAGTFELVQDGNVLDNDTRGADGARVTGIQHADDASVTSVPGTGNLVIDGKYGKLTIHSDGSYSYQRNPGTEGGVEDVFEYTITDGDGDTSSASLTISIGDSAPTVDIPSAGSATTTVHESGLPDGSDNIPDRATTSGSIEFNSADGLGTVSLGGYTLTETDQTFPTTGPAGSLTARYEYDPVTGKGTIHYSYTLEGTTDGDNTSVSFPVVITDQDGDAAPSGDLTIEIVNDTPTARPDEATVTEGDRVTGDVLGNDQSGADGWYGNGDAVVDVTSDNAPGNTVSNVGGVLTIEGQYGTLTLNADGSYTYVSRANAVTRDEQDVFTYTVRDADGDETTATLTINVNDVTGLSRDTTGTVDEAGLPAGSDSSSDKETTGGSLNLADGWTVDPSSVGNQSSGIGTLTINVDGSYSYELTSRTEDVTGVEETDTFTYTARDQYGNTVTNTVTITIIDDVPSVTLTGNALGEVQVDETSMGTSASADFSGAFNHHFGADGDNGAGLVYALEVDTAATGLVDTETGDPIVLVESSDGLTVTGHVGDDSGPAAFTISVDANGEVTLTQSRPLQHSDPNNHDDVLTLPAGSLKLTGTVTDGDGDTDSASVDIGGRFSFRDDGPTIGAAPAPGVVDEAYLTTGSGDGTAGLSTETGADLDVDFGSDGQGSLVFSDDQVALRNWLDASGNTDITITGTGTEVLSGTRGGQEIFTVTLTVDANGQASYHFELKGALLHRSHTQDHELTFSYAAVDGDGDRANGTFRVDVKDDKPRSEITINVDEDDANGPFTTSADATQDNTTISMTDGGPALPGTLNGNDLDYDVGHGTVTVHEDGRITYAPNPDYSNHGSPDDFYVTVAEDDGTSRTIEVTVNVIPVADAPELTVDTSSVTTNEDEAIGLGLDAPKTTDDNDQNGSGTAGDNPERLGPITLSGFPAGAQLLDGTDSDSPLHTFDGTGSITIVISDNGDGPHFNGATGTLTLTTAQYEALKVLPPAESSANFTVDVSVTSYEVDESGNPLTEDVNGDPIDGAESTVSVTVNVQAVTDGIDLTIHNGDDNYVNADSTANAVTLPAFDEDGSINLKDYLQITLDETGDGNSGADTDGSEQRWFEVSGVPVGWTVDGVLITTPGQSVPVTIPNDYNGASPSLPDIVIQPPADFSGDLDGVRVTLYAQDRDSDGPNPLGTQISDSVYLNLRINPQGGDVAADDVTTEEDTAVAFLKHVRVTDTGTGNEIITEVEFSLPDGWVLVDKPAGEGTDWAMTGSGTTVDPYIISSLNGTDLEEVLGDFTVLPPAHSSKDEDIVVRVTSTDTNTVDGGSVSDTDYRDLTITVEVTPKGERIEDVGHPDRDTDGNDTPDLTMTPGRDYTTPGEEDEWFTLGQETGFNLKDGWSNEDGRGVENGGTAGSGSEETFALLTPNLIAGDGSQADATGSEFRWGPNGEFSDTFDGINPVEVPIEYLDTLQFKAAPHFSGMFEIKVQAKTVDYDEDYPGDESRADVQVSGDATLTNILIAPKADTVTATVTARVEGDEDERMPLSIRPKSSDPSESFEVDIDGIPDGATLWYDGHEITAESVGDQALLDAGITVTDNGDGTWKVEFADFDPEKGGAMEIQAPEDSNKEFDLTVTARSVDTLEVPGDPDSPYVSKSPDHSLNITVAPKGVADEALIDLIDYDDPIDGVDPFTEADVEANGGIALSDLIIRAELKDDDGSEVLTFKISGLPEGFSIEGGTFMGGSGTGREWSLTKDQLANAKLVTPPNFNGSQTFELSSVTTENDGDSLTVRHQVEVRVSPSPEATINLGAVLDEDVSGKLDFSIQHQNGDTDELLSEVWINASDLAGLDDLTLTYGQGGQSLADAAADATNPHIVLEDGYYKLSGDAIDDIYAQGRENWHGDASFGVHYVITDPGHGGMVDVSEGTDGTYNVTVNPITDQVTLAIPDADISMSGAGNTTITLDIGNTGSDYDGSEQLTRVILDNVPEGVVVVGTTDYTVDYVGGGTWVLIPTDGSFDGAQQLDIRLQVHGRAGGLEDHPIGVTVVTEDAGNGQETRASRNVTMSTDFPEGEPELPAIINRWEQTDFEPTEDIAFNLGQAIDASIDATGVVDSGFTVTLTDLPPGTEVSGMTRTMVAGQEVWSASGSGGNAELQALLDSITVTPPADFNHNQGSFDYNATLTTHTPSGGRAQESIRVEQEVTPVTDQADITITMDAVDEGQDLDIHIDVSNSADDPNWTLIDGKLYLTLDEPAGMTGGQLLDSDGNPLTAVSVTGVDGVTDGTYYVIDVGSDNTVDLTYRPAGPHVSGNITLEATVVGREANAGNTITTTTTQDGTINPVNSGYDFTVADAVGSEPATAGDKQEAIQLNVTGNGLTDDDGSESVLAVLLKNLPNDFLVFVGKDAASAELAELANNAGGAGTNTWLLELDADGNLPSYIAILPPKNWSGTLEGLELVVISGEGALSEERTDSRTFSVTVEPVANGLTIVPTPSFGKEGEIIGLNLNARFEDLRKAGTTDESVERATVELKGLGEHAAIYVGGNLIMDRVTYDKVNDVYTITGLTQDEIDQLGFVQAAGDINNLQVRARTEEYDASTGVPVAGIAPSGWTHGTDGSWGGAAVTTNITAQFGTAGADELLWTGQGILNGRGGDDTVQLRFGESLEGSDLAAHLRNIEMIDLSIEGENRIEGLKVEDVLAMTDDRNTLKIFGDSDDSVSLDDPGAWSYLEQQTEGDKTFNVYEGGGATLWVEQGVQGVIID